jgi:hypothetical protein
VGVLSSRREKFDKMKLSYSQPMRTKGWLKIRSKWDESEMQLNMEKYYFARLRRRGDRGRMRMEGEAWGEGVGDGEGFDLGCGETGMMRVINIGAC